MLVPGEGSEQVQAGIQRSEQTGDANYLLNIKLRNIKLINKIFCHQITHLLKEVEELRHGRNVSMATSSFASPTRKTRRSSQSQVTSQSLVVNDDGSCNDVSSSSEVIANSLVTFNDISDLQEQNRKLLAVSFEIIMHIFSVHKHDTNLCCN